MLNRLDQLAGLGMCAIAANLSAQSAKASTFIVTNGPDTVAVESFTRDATSLVGDLQLGQGPRANHVIYTLRLRADGSASRAEVVDGAPNFFSGWIAFDAATMTAARADPAGQGKPIRMAPPNSYPEIGTSIAMMEQLIRAAHLASGASTRMTAVNIRNGLTANLVLTRFAPDSVLIECDGCMRASVREEIRAAVSGSGDIIGGSNPTLNWTITRR